MFLMTGIILDFTCIVYLLLGVMFTDSFAIYRYPVSTYFAFGVPVGKTVCVRDVGSVWPEWSR